jgi:hypothetical protein
MIYVDERTGLMKFDIPNKREKAVIDKKIGA